MLSSRPLGGGRSDRDSDVVVAAHLVEFEVGGGEADVEPFEFAGPPFQVGFVDAGDEVDSDLFEPSELVRVWAKQRASDARVFVDAWRRIGATADPEFDFS